MNKSAPVRPHLWVGLVLHALDQHALDDFHVVLLLVAEDSRKVPAGARVRVNPGLLLESLPHIELPCRNQKSLPSPDRRTETPNSHRKAPAAPQQTAATQVSVQVHTRGRHRRVSEVYQKGETARHWKILRTADTFGVNKPGCWTETQSFDAEFWAVRRVAHQKMCSAASRRLTLSEFTESNRNFSSSCHWLFPSSSKHKKAIKKERKGKKKKIRLALVCATATSNAWRAGGRGGYR